MGVPAYTLDLNLDHNYYYQHSHLLFKEGSLMDRKICSTVVHVWRRRNIIQRKSLYYRFSMRQFKLKILYCSSLDVANRFYLLSYNYFYLPKESLQIVALILLHLRLFNLKKTVVQKMFKTTIAVKGISWCFNEIFCSLPVQHSQRTGSILAYFTQILQRASCTMN